MAITSIENVIKLLYSYNPWWRVGTMPQDMVKPLSVLHTLSPCTGWSMIL